MAHLVWCSRCGKRYRCDIEHPPPRNVCTFMEVEHENNCPDVLFHPPRRELHFYTISSEKFENPEQEIASSKTIPIRASILFQSLKATK